jgi:hypothetical protein
VQGTLFACLDHFSPAEVKMVFATKLAAGLRGQPPQLPNQIVFGSWLWLAWPIEK